MRWSEKRGGEEGGRREERGGRKREGGTERQRERESFRILEANGVRTD